EDGIRDRTVTGVQTCALPIFSESVIEDWHRQGKRFVAEVGINSQARTAEEHFTFWSGFYHKTPFLDGIIIDEFIVNRPVSEWVEDRKSVGVGKEERGGWGRRR